MTYPTKNQALDMLTEWSIHHKRLSNLDAQLKLIFGRAVEGEHFDAVWKMFDAYTDALSFTLGDESEWLAWYCSENDMGAKRYEAGNTRAEIKPIKNLRDLLWLIERGRV